VAAGTSLGRAWIEVTADASGVANSLDKDVAAALRKLANSVEKELDDIADEAERVGDRVSGSVDKSSGVATKSLLGLVIGTGGASGALLGLGAAGAGAFAGVSAGAAGAVGAVAALGIGVAATNQKVQDSFTDLGHHITASMKSSTAPLVPVLTGLAGTFQSTFDDRIGPMLSGIFTQIAPVVQTFGSVVASVVGTVAPLLGQVVTAGLPIVNLIAGELMPLAQNLAGVLSSVIGAISGTASAFVGNLFGALDTILPALGQLITALVQVGGPVLSALMPPLAMLIAELGTQLAGVLTAIAPSIVQVATIFGQLLTAISPLLGIIAALLVQLAPVAVVFAQVLVGAINALMPVIGTLVPVIGSLIAALMPVVSVIVRLAGQLIGMLLPALTPIIPVVIQLARQIGSALITVLRAAMPAFSSIIRAVMMLLPAFLPLIPAILRIVSALLPLIPIVARLVAQFVSGLVPILMPLITLIVKVASVVSSLLVLAINRLMGPIRTVAGLFSGFMGIVQHLEARLVSFLAGIGGKVIGAFAGAGRWLVNVGGDLIRGLINGASGLLRNLGHLFLNLIPGWIRGPFESAMGIGSPSRVFHQYGIDLGRGLINGLTSSSKTVQTTASKLAASLIKGYGDYIKKRDALLTKLTNTGDAVARAEASRGRGRALAIQVARRHQREAAQALLDLQRTYGQLGDRRAVTAAVARLRAGDDGLVAIAKRREKIAAQLKVAQGKLADAVKLRNDFATSVRNAAHQFADLSSIQTGGDVGVTAESIVADLSKRLAAIKAFRANLAALQRMGVSNTVYQQLAQAGVDAGGQMAAALVEGGKNAIKSVNTLQKGIDAAAAGLGTDTSRALYQSGVNAAAGVVKGLQDRQAQLAKVGENMASALVSAVGRTLHLPTAARRMAVGAYVDRPTFAVVGEAGPELVLPLSASRAARRDQLVSQAGLGGGPGGGVNVTYAPSLTVPRQATAVEAAALVGKDLVRSLRLGLAGGDLGITERAS
jgi:phage-related protein